MVSARPMSDMEVFGLVGNPVGHSLSPIIHEAAYDEAGIEARYVTFEVNPDDLDAAIGGAEALGLRGLNVTIPFKRDVLGLVDPEPLAERIGAVNTIAFDPARGRPRGYNTDADGAVRALTSHGVSLAGATAVVVGAGGAGRAIAIGLADAGATIRITNRTESRARDVAATVEATVDDARESGSWAEEPAADVATRASAHPLDSLPTLLDDADVLVNATSVGMGEDASPVPRAVLHEDLVVMDAVYRPLETRLLREADAAGARTIDGAWMLLYQASAAFERWFDELAPEEAMNEALRQALAQ